MEGQPSVKKQRFEEGSEVADPELLTEAEEEEKAKAEEDAREREEEEKVAKLTVRMKGIPFEGVTESDIALFFEDLEIEDEGIFIAPLTRVAYIQFKNEENVKLALGKSHTFQGRSISITQAKPFHRTKDIGVAAAAEHFSEAPFSGESFVIQIRFLPYWTTEDRVMEFYKDFEVLAIHMVWDHIGRLSSSAFLEFANEEDQKRALETVKKVDERGKCFPLEHSKLVEMLAMLHPPIPRKRTILIKMVRLHNDVTEDDVRAFFSDIRVNSVWLSKNFLGKCTGTGFIVVPTYEIAFKALAKTGGSIGVSVASESGKIITKSFVIGLYPSCKGEVMATLPSMFLGIRRNTTGRGGRGGRGGYGWNRRRGYGGQRGRFGNRGRGSWRGRKRRQDTDGQPSISKEDLDAEMDTYRSVKANALTTEE